MRKPTKKVLKILTFSLATTALVGCSNGKNMNQAEYVEAVYEEKAVFVETYANNHIDVLVGDAKKMYEIPEDLVKKVESIKENDIIVIEYSLDNELKKNIKDIKMVGASKKTAEVKPKEAKKVAEKPKEKQEQVDLQVYKEGKWTKEKATVGKINDQYEVKVLKGYEIQGNKIVSQENGSYYVELEELPKDSEIKPQRWRAADELKQIGELKELLSENIYDPNFRKSEFVFTSHNNEIQQNIVVRSEDGHLIRYHMVFPSSEQSPTIEAALWAMMEGLEYL